MADATDPKAAPTSGATLIGNFLTDIDTTKEPWKSKTIWGLGFMLLGGFLQGHPEWFSGALQFLPGAMLTLGAALGGYGRMTATGPLK